MRRRGYLLVLVLMLGSVLFVLAAYLVRLQTDHHALARRLEREILAEAAARGGRDEALLELRQNPLWAEPLERRFERSGTTYRIRFDGQDAYSTSNAGGSEPVTGFGERHVPPGSIHLVCRGEARGVYRLEEALVDPGRVLLDEHFDGDALQWAQQGGSPPLTLNSHYVLEAGSLSLSTFAGDPGWSNYGFSADISVTSGVGAGLWVRTTGAPQRPTGYRFDYDATLAPLEGGTFLLRQVVAGQDQPPLASVVRSRTPLAGLGNWLLDTTHRFEVEARGDRLTAFADGVQLLELQDSAYSHGQVGLRGPSGTLVLADRVTVRSLFTVTALWQRGWTP